MNTNNPNRFFQSDIDDAARTLRWFQLRRLNPETAKDTMLANGEDEWIVESKNIPTAWYAAEVLAPRNGITCSRRECWRGMDRRWCAFAVARKGDGPFARAQIGASSWANREVAICFAYRNAIRGLLPMQPNTGERMAYRDTQDNALARYA